MRYQVIRGFDYSLQLDLTNSGFHKSIWPDTKDGFRNSRHEKKTPILNSFKHKRSIGKCNVTFQARGASSVWSLANRQAKKERMSQWKHFSPEGNPAHYHREPYDKEFCILQPRSMPSRSSSKIQESPMCLTDT